MWCGVWYCYYYYTEEIILKFYLNQEHTWLACWIIKSCVTWGDVVPALCQLFIVFIIITVGDGWVRWRVVPHITTLSAYNISSALVNTKHINTHISLLYYTGLARHRPSSEANIEYNGSIFKSLDIFFRFIVRRWYFRIRLVLVYLLQTVTELDHQGWLDWTSSDVPNLNNCSSWVKVNVKIAILVSSIKGPVVSCGLKCSNTADTVSPVWSVWPDQGGSGSLAEIYQRSADQSMQHVSGLTFRLLICSRLW